MTQNIDVTYTGSDEPFVDRIYHSGLTFSNGQTRSVPAALAHRFLRHADVFQQGKQGNTKAAGTEENQEQDDTAQQLETSAKAEADRKDAENKRFEVLQQIDRMDKEALRDFAKVNFKQDIHHKVGLEKARDMVRGFVDQFGMPA